MAVMLMLRVWLLVLSFLTVSTVTLSTERRAAETQSTRSDSDGGSALRRLTGRKLPLFLPPPALKAAPVEEGPQSPNEALVLEGPRSLNEAPVEEGPRPLKVAQVEEGPQPLKGSPVKEGPRALKVAEVEKGPRPLKVVPVEEGPRPLKAAPVEVGPRGLKVKEGPRDLKVKEGPRALKAAEVEEDVAAGAELPPKPLPQTMLPRNMTAADALKPPLGAAQVAPPPRQLVDVDVCRGYFDVMGHFDSTFNCSRGSYIYCCGTCHYRFCCEHQRDRLDQDSCNNYITPGWVEPLGPATQPAGPNSDPDFETLQQQSSSTAYVIGGVISFTLVVAVGVRIAFSKVARRPRNRDNNVPRSLVDILRHQSSPVTQGERNNSSLLSTAADGRSTKNIYTPVLQSKDNRTGTLPHPFNQQGAPSSPKHTATIERGPRMNNAPQLPPLPGSKGPSLGPGGMMGSGSMRHSGHPSFSHSFHNLAQLPPSYEAAMRPEVSRYSSLKRLEKELDEYSNSYYSSKRRGNNAPPSFHSSQHHLPWGGEYTLGSRGTLPLHGSRPRLHIPTSTPNPYPLPSQSAYSSSSFDRPPRRVRSQDQLLALGEGNTLSRLSKNQQHQYYRGGAGSMSGGRAPASQTLRRSHERLLLDERLLMGERPGVPTMGRLSHQKAQSQQNICATPSMERHHMIKMNSHPTSGHDHERGSSAPSHWDPYGHAPGAMAPPSARRMAFAAKRQNTIEQLHFLPGGGGGLRTGSKNEVTV